MIGTLNGGALGAGTPALHSVGVRRQLPRAGTGCAVSHRCSLGLVAAPRLWTVAPAMVSLREASVAALLRGKCVVCSALRLEGTFRTLVPRACRGVNAGRPRRPDSC